jgi:hypothetical protein
MSRRTEMYVLAGLLVLVIAAGVYYYLNTHNDGGALPGVLAADTKFQPLDVREPGLRLDLMAKIRKLDYPGAHRNIFIATPPPPPKPTGPAAAEVARRPVVGPRVPPPPPPLQIAAEFFGYASQPKGGQRFAFFTSGDEILVVGEGDTFLKIYRLDRINNDSADVEEISSGRHQTVPLVQPPDQGAGASQSQ